MTCQECDHEWNGDMATCPACGFTPENSAVILPSIPALDTQHSPGLKLKFKDLSSTPKARVPAEKPVSEEHSIGGDDLDRKKKLERPTANSQPPTVSIEGTEESEARFPSAEDVIPVGPENRNDPAVGDDEPVTGEGWEKISIRKTALQAEEEVVAPPPERRPRTKSKRRKRVELAILFALVAMCFVTAGFRHVHQAQINANTVAAKSPVRPDDVHLNLSNISGRPLVVRIGNRVIALDDGQCMNKAISKGKHKIGWWCEFGDKTVSESLPPEDISTDASWRFEMVSKNGHPTVIRLSGPRS